MKHAIIIAHPADDSFTQHMARTYADAAQSLGHDVIVRDLYRMGFEPRLSASEIPDGNGFEPGDDVRRERELLADADVFALFYPLWFNAAPAILKGYVDRVFGLGFGYGPIEHGGNQPLLSGRKLISFTSSGAPNQWVVDSGAWEAMRKHFDHHLAAVCGLAVVDHVNFGGIARGIRADAVERCAAVVRKAVEELFQAKTPAT